MRGQVVTYDSIALGKVLRQCIACAREDRKLWATIIASLYSGTELRRL